jgi:hypothetical protein
MYIELISRALVIWVKWGFNCEKGIVSSELRVDLERVDAPGHLFGNGSLLLGPTEPRFTYYLAFRNKS